MLVISRDDAIAIFRAKHTRASTRCDNLSTKLAAQYNISQRTVRDIWNLRTWTHATVPFWTTSDHKTYLLKNNRPKPGNQDQEHRSSEPCSPEPELVASSISEPAAARSELAVQVGEEDGQEHDSGDARLLPFSVSARRIYLSSLYFRANRYHDGLLEEALDNV